MGIKLMLDAAAIEKVLESAGPEASVELRSSIVQEFVKKYLKGVISDKALEKARQDCMSEIHNHITAFYADITKGSYGKETYTLKPEIAQDVKDRAKAAVENRITDLVNQSISEINLAPLVTAAVERRVSFLIREEVKRQVDAAMSAALKVIAEEING